MKKALSFTMCILASTYASTALAEERNGWYIGALYNSQTISIYQSREFKSAGAIAGYKINDIFSIETRLHKGTSGYSFNLLEPGFEDKKYKQDLDYQGHILAKASYSITEAFNVYALAGYTKTKTEITTLEFHTDLSGNTSVTYPHQYSENTDGFSYGVGLNYQIYNQFSVFVDYQVLPDFDKYQKSGSWDSLNLGVNYSF
ncbi:MULTISPECIES: porin family protein [Colwellia]|uniref:Putative outer membrane protein n=1 Tax=Colwellia psychrerythraea (strain 34H / ATCC BAA-681) TaxID=167879 RepID=Q480R8_COLP3|nr:MULTISPECIES: porin family protein [Colwellia]AAZ27902.1 putative outer membrane protein [Colwellia psychrerythraea 34H]PKH87700.1 porin family protein [Colwellia sp. Bg11-28]